MGFNIDKLREIAVPRSETAKESARLRRENREYLRISQDIALCIHYYLRNSDMTQKELAEKMEVSPVYIGRLLKGGENLRLETICKLQKVLGQDLISVAKPYVTTQIVSLVPLSTQRFSETVRSDRYTETHTLNKNYSSTGDYSAA